jgi:hypothetical protein
MWAQLPALARLDSVEMASVHLHLTVADAGRFPALQRLSTASGLVAIEKVGDAFSRVVAADCAALHQLLAALAPDTLTELIVRDVPSGHRDDITAFARSQRRLARFEMNGIDRPGQT